MPELTRSSVRFAVAGAAASAAMLVAAQAAWATDYPVNTTADTGSGSLRDAITAVDGDSTPDTITITATGMLTLGSALPSISNDVTIIQRSGISMITASGNSTR